MLDRANVRSLAPRPEDLAAVVQAYEDFKAPAREWNKHAGGKRLWGAHRAKDEFRQAAQRACEAITPLRRLIEFRCREVSGWETEDQIDRELQMLRAIDDPAPLLDLPADAPPRRFPCLPAYFALRWCEAALDQLLEDVAREHGVEPIDETLHRLEFLTALSNWAEEADDDPLLDDFGRYCEIHKVSVTKVQPTMD